MVEFNRERKEVVLPEVIEEHISHMVTVNGCTKVDALLDLQEMTDQEVNPMLSKYPEVREYAKLPYKTRMGIMSVLNAGYTITSYSKLAEKEYGLRHNNTFGELVENVRQWAYDKKLNEADPARQMLKVIEELGEVGASMARQDLEGIIDGIGDVTVTLIILAAQHDVRFEHCLEVAYNEIKERKGEMVNGVFVKEADLNAE